MAKISKLVINKRIKLVYLIPLANNMKWKMITGVNTTHICDGLNLWEADEKVGVWMRESIWLKYQTLC